MIHESILEGGRITVPDEPGLGIEVDMDALTAHVAENDTVFE
jgi:gluconate/galactonate dehydratase